MNNNLVFLISAGLLRPKKEENHFSKKNLYPNYGLISLGTILKSKGYKPIIIHGDHKPPETIIGLMDSYGIIQSNKNILLSLPSFFSLSWAQKFCEKLYKYKKNIIIGGKWVVSGNEKWLASRLKGIDQFISINAENIIENLVQNIEINNSSCNANHNTPRHLDYSLVHNYTNYQPSIEISRGCGQGCSFCLEKREPYQLINSPKNVVLSIMKHEESYQSDNITPYFQTSFFNPTMNWCLELLKYFQKYSLTTKWRTQTRVDSLSKGKINLLSQAGLKVLDLGLESASHKQLLAMGKSKNPYNYLNKASQLLRNCYENNIWIKLNLLFYPGETLATIEETRDWISFHKKYIKGLSINPLFIYRYNGVEEYLQSIKEVGASLVSEDSLNENGYAFLNLSDSITFVNANKISKRIRQEMMSEKDFFDLKSFSYFDRYYSYIDFENDIKEVDHSSLPFNINAN
jgi:radical SAM superfamily enzyme YgiQ (UPF0313 family)